MNTTSLSLLKELQQADAEPAWERFVKLYAPLLHEWVRKAGLQGADADDLVQDIFVTLLAKLPEFAYDSGKSFRGWLRTIAVNRCRNRLRDRQHDPQTDRSGALAAAGQPDPLEEFWEHEYRQHLIISALERMQVEFRPATWQAAWALIIEDRDPTAVAAELKVSVPAVYVAKSRVLARLRTLLDGMLD